MSSRKRGVDRPKDATDTTETTGARTSEPVPDTTPEQPAKPAAKQAARKSATPATAAKKTTADKATAPKTATKPAPTAKAPAKKAAAKAPAKKAPAKSPAKKTAARTAAPPPLAGPVEPIAQVLSSEIIGAVPSNEVIAEGAGALTGEPAVAPAPEPAPPEEIVEELVPVPAHTVEPPEPAEVAAEPTPEPEPGTVVPVGAEITPAPEYAAGATSDTEPLGAGGATRLEDRSTPDTVVVAVAAPTAAVLDELATPALAASATPSPTMSVPAVDPSDLARILAGVHTDPHRVLGAHPVTMGDVAGVVVRALVPDAVRVECVLYDAGDVERHAAEMQLEAEGGPGNRLFSVFLPDETLPLRYRFRFHYADGAVWDRGDPYRFLPTLGDVDLHLFNEGTHRRLWEVLGAHVRTIDGVRGVSFAVWAPNARRVSVVGDFCGWDGRLFPMRVMGASGVFEIFIPDIGPGSLYKFEMLTPQGMLRVKSDPFAAKMQQSPADASIVQEGDTYAWRDGSWMATRQQRSEDTLRREPMSIYEVHLGSWARVPEEGNRALTYREIAPRLAAHVEHLGFTHVELLPVMEHPFYGSWGYQVSGYYAPTSRYGTPDDFRFLVDTLHQHGIGVILDWVPAHFPKDDYALRRFDGTALYEHEDPRLGEHPDWGTLIFNYGRSEVRNFLVANALYWLQEFHADGLRVDAVASMLYLDYSREAGQWVQNRLGGRENLDAIEFLKQFNETIRLEAPGCFTVAEESTAWPGVTKPVSEGGLGFTFKWNMGWMHDTLSYFAIDPLFRRYHQDQLTFGMMYEYSEHFIMPLSHDEVVHLKGSLFGKMAGDEWQRLANLRLLLAYMFARPGKKLLFMGTEFAPYGEWNHDTSLDWHLLHDPQRGAFFEYVRRLAEVYRAHPEFWREDPSWDGFRWVDIGDRENSVVSFIRRAGDRHVVVVLNLTPVPRECYRIGMPEAGAYVKLLSSDDGEWGGSGHGWMHRVETDSAPLHGFPQSAALNLPPLGALILAPEAESVPG